MQESFAHNFNFYGNFSNSVITLTIRGKFIDSTNSRIRYVHTEYPAKPPFPEAKFENGALSSLTFYQLDGKIWDKTFRQNDTFINYFLNDKDSVVVKYNATTFQKYYSESFRLTK